MQDDCLMLAMVFKHGPRPEKVLLHRHGSDIKCLAYRVTRFDKDDTPDLSQLGQSRNERYGSKFDAYDSRPDVPSNRETYRQSDHSDSSFSAVRERVQMGIATSHSHTEALQDLVLSLSEGSSRRDAESDKSALKDLVKEMLTFRCSPLHQSRTSHMHACLQVCVYVHMADVVYVYVQITYVCGNMYTYNICFQT